MRIEWEEIESRTPDQWAPMHRAKVPGGWLVVVHFQGTGITFYPDPGHEWDGNSLP